MSKPRNLLFVDDCPFRRDFALRFYGSSHSVFLASTIFIAMRFMLENEFEVVHLDHDMVGPVYQDPRESSSGSALVRWALKNRPKVGEFRVHSMNTAQGNRMVDALRIAGYQASYRNIVEWCEKGAWS